MHKQRLRNKVQPPRGMTRLHYVQGGGQPTFDPARKIWLPPGFSPDGAWRKNLVMYDWAAIACQLFGSADRRYRLSTMYIEFCNVASPGDAVPIPSYTRSSSDARAYYDSLAESSDTDYVRADIISAVVSSTDEDTYPNGNMLTLFGLATAVEGVHGKTFSYAANSKVYGAALVATPDNDDPTQDLVMSRAYYLESKQMIKLDSVQMGNEWLVTFG